MKNFLKNLDKGEIYTLLAAICFAIAISNDRILLQKFPDPIEFIIYDFGLPTIFLTLISPKSLLLFRPMLKGNCLKFVMASIVFYIIAVAFFVTSLKIASNGSLVIAVNQINIIISVVLGIIFLHERENLRKVAFSALLGLVGVILLAI